MPYRPRLHGKRWRVRWRQGGRILTRTFSSRGEADAFAIELESSLAALREALARQRAALTVRDVVDEYYTRRKRRLQASTQHHYEQIISKHIDLKIGPLNARELSDNPAPLQDFYDELPATTAMHAHQILRPAFQYAVDHKRLERNPCSIARPPRKKRPEKLIPTATEVTKIVLAAHEVGECFGLYVWITSRLGLRRGEACALRWEDFDVAKREIRIQRTVARYRGGTYIKPPKSGEARTIQMDARFFAKLAPLRQPEGWLFPRGYNIPYSAERGLTPHSTAGRFLALLVERRGILSSSNGAAGIETALLLGLGKYSAGPMLRRLERDGYLRRTGNRSRTYRIELTEAGRSAIASLSPCSLDGLPWFPTTADQKFRALMDALDLPYTLHSLRHFTATHLYNRTRDWVQLARFLGHSSPAITMNLYANHVVDETQLALGAAAMDLFDDLT